jgi:FMN phosphatase YigB (HAD superfamily)
MGERKMSDEPMIVVVDLDGTLCDTRFREHHAQNKEWDEFNRRCPEDTPHEDVRWLLGILGRLPQEQVQIVALTGRDEKYHTQTMNWLVQHMIAVDELIMRPAHDYTSDHELKPRLLLQRYKKEQVAFILEDRDRVVEAWRNLGFNCWQVRVGGY